ncbi:hypothetical protein K6V98_05945 [Collinsella sp. AGMB00827]|uniref:ABC transporter permease n=1 Tax=Collinsella ureilytica TaxID=2869515 RepID=A0ABS7MKJ3_9ACTN|nr:hypothetical protein [Collinsella urealyticum]MBY4797891.1 hypothetical protein [Collinsella urealyticum]
MMNLIRIELSKALRNPWFLIAVGIGLCISLVSAISNLLYHFENGIFELQTYRYVSPAPDSCYHWWISLDGLQPSSALFFQLMPLLSVIPYAWSSRAELNWGYSAQLYTRTNRSSCACAKGIAVFISSGLIVLIPVVINFLLLACFIPAYQPDVYEMIYFGIAEGDLWSETFYTFPQLYVIGYSILPFIMCGCWGLFVSGLGYFIDNRVILLTAPYLVLLFITFVNERIFIALGSLNGFQLSFAKNMRAMVESYDQDGRVIALECIVLFISGILLSWYGMKKDVI